MVKRKSKRANQEGSIYQRKNGLWRAQVSIEGHRLSFSANTHAECREWIRKTLGKFDGGLTYQDTQLIIRDYFVDWLANVKVSLRIKTHEQYAQIVRDYISPSLGKVKVRELTAGHIHHLYAKHRESGVSDRTIGLIHSVLRRALGNAVELGIIPSNPVALVKPPRVKKKEMKFYNAAQVQRMLITAFEDRYLALWKLAVTAGLRQAELLGLKWIDLDWNRASLHVRRQLRRVRGGGFDFSQPKTKAGNRTIILGKETLELLKRHEEHLYLERLVAGSSWRENDLIFPSSIGTPTQPDKIIKRFKRLCKLAGLPEIRFHDLRHTAATLMLNNGVPLIVVSKRLGHAQPSITLDVYGHVIPAMQEHVAELMDQITTPISLEIPS